MSIQGIHHFALLVEDRDSLLKWKRRLVDLGIPVNGPLDRHYLESIYLRDPDGAVVELATRGPGFTVDESAAEFGTGLKLPPWLEGRRGELERTLQPISVPTWQEEIVS